MTEQNNNIKHKIKNVRNSTLFVVVFCSFITTFTGSALNLSIPDISSEFNTGAVLIGWVVTGFILSSAVLSVPFGRFADLKGRKLVLIIGIFIFGVSAAFCAFAWSIEALIAFRLMQGIGAAMIFSTNQALLISVFPPEERGRALGFAISSTYFGLAIGPVIGGFMNNFLGWRSIFILTCLVTLIVFPIAIIKLPAPVSGTGNSMDIWGNILYIVMLTCVMYGLNSFTTEWHGKWFFLIGIILLVVFVRHELVFSSPIINVRLFKDNLVYSLSNIAALLNYGASYAISYLLSIYLQTVMHFDSHIAGLILVANPIIMTVLSPIAGKLSDRISPFKLTSFGMALTALGLFSFIFIDIGYPLWLIVVNIVVIGVGFAFFSSPNTNAIMGCVDKKDYSVATSILATARSIGHTLSMVIVTLVVSLQIGNIILTSADPGSIIKTLHYCFIIFTILCIIGTFISAKRKAD